MIWRDHRATEPTGDFAVERATFDTLQEDAWFARNGWWAREDSNLRPDRYERSALTT